MWTIESASLQEEPSSRALHALLKRPFVVAVLGVVCAFLQPPKLHRKARPNLNQFDLVLGFKHIAMSPDKDKVALIVERHRLPTSKLGLRREQGGKVASDGVAEPRVEVV
jgi:hypothetical protein